MNRAGRRADDAWRFVYSLKDSVRVPVLDRRCFGSLGEPQCVSVGQARQIHLGALPDAVMPTSPARPRFGTVSVVRKALVIVLVLLVVLTSLPLAVGMANVAVCPDCGTALLPMAGVCLIALATALMLVFAPMVTWLRALGVVVPRQLVPRPLQHPPRVA